MAGRNAIDKHPAKDYIRMELAKNTPYRNIVEQFSGEISIASLSRYKKLHLPKHLTKAQEAKEVSNADKVLAELKRIRGYADRLIEACDRELRDLDNPEQYDIGPRAGDVDITYVEFDEERKPRRLKAKLSVLLQRLIDGSILPAAHTWKIADPRELILKAHKALRKDLEFLARLWGEIKSETPAAILVTDPTFIQVQAIILDATMEMPEVRQRIAHALKQLGE